MNQRERFIETMRFGNPDRVPFAPGHPREKTLSRWQREGLPDGVAYMEAVYDALGFHPNEPAVPASDLGVDFRMIPQFEEKVLEHRDGHYIVQDWMGAITEISDEYDYTYIRYGKDFVTRKWHKFPVEGRDDWENMKCRYESGAEGRFPDDFEERCRAHEGHDDVAMVHFNAPFWQLREWCGMERLCVLMIDDPVDEMARFWADFVSATMQPVLDRVRLEYIEISEDMAYKAHSMISPAMARRFLQPSYDRWVPAIKAGGCPVVNMDSDGRVDELMPIWIESGINSCRPMEVAAGNDIVALRERFGTDMAFMGGIDKRSIAAGGDEMRREVMRVVPPLLRDGGYIPGCDHGVPHDISWSDFVDYSRLLAELTGWI